MRTEVQVRITKQSPLSPLELLAETDALLIELGDPAVPNQTTQQPPEPDHNENTDELDSR